MRIRILAAGRLHEPFWKEAEKEYRKRLSAYAPEGHQGEGRGEDPPEG